MLNLVRNSQNKISFKRVLDEMEEYYQVFLAKVQGEDDVKNVYAESSYHFTRALMTFALLDDLTGQQRWHLEYKVTGDSFFKLSDTNGKSLVPAEPRNGF
jgi:hypothetical protein